MHGQGTIRLTELNADVRSVKPGTEKVIWKGGFGKDRALGCGFGMGGSHMYKINGKYYILCPVGGTAGGRSAFAQTISTAHMSTVLSWMMIGLIPGTDCIRAEWYRP